MAIELAVFDLAGTTVEDPDGVGRALKNALAAAGIVCEDAAVNAVMGMPKPMAIRDLMTQFRPDMEANAETVHAIFRDFQARMLDYYRNDPDVREIEGTREVFTALKSRGIKVGIDTGFDRSIVNVLIERLGWDDTIIDATVASDEVPNGRPYPDMIFDLMSKTGVKESSRVAKIGDTRSDLEEGTSAGCSVVVGVLSGTHSREDLLPYPHTHILESIRDLPALL